MTIDARPSVPAVERRQRQQQIVAGVLARGDRVLLCHRGPGRWYPDSWDLPGGHIDVGESASAALARELREELGIEVAELTLEPAGRLTLDDFDLRVWLVTEWSGEPENVSPDEHDAIAWFAPTAIRHLGLDDRYVSLIDRILAEPATKATTARKAAALIRSEN